jgi:hypothetical protein
MFNIKNNQIGYHLSVIDFQVIQIKIIFFMYTRFKNFETSKTIL